jgi:prephenate dehydrogenase
MGGSVGLALRAQGWFVTADDTDDRAVTRGIELGAFDAAGVDPDADITFICTPVQSVADLARKALEHGGIVTDIGGVKQPITDAVDHPRFIGGHPMAGSEQDGIDSSDVLMFQGRTWVLTPTPSTDPEAFTRLHAVVSSLGALVISVPPERHDELVAVVSHVPHLAAATLMRLAAKGAEEHAALLRLAAGGFRDMTRIAAGHPAIWLDVCEGNRDAIVRVLDQFIGDLGGMRAIVAGGDRDGLLRWLERARVARMNLPTGAPPPEELVEMRVPIPDRPGFIAEVSTLASELGVNIYDIEISHTIEGGGGVLVVVLASSASDLMRGGLLARGFRPSVAPLESS